MQAFKVGVFYKLFDVAINQLELRLEAERHQVVELFKLLFSETMLNFCLTRS
jgi:hypothetical protein